MMHNPAMVTTANSAVTGIPGRPISAIAIAATTNIGTTGLKRA